MTMPRTASPTPAAFVVGCGDVGRRIARLLRANGRHVGALARSAGRADELADLGIEPTPGDLDDPASLEGLPLAATDLFYLAPPPRGGTTDPRMRAFVAALEREAPPARVVYLSTTGVYGDQGGAWVDETTPPRPGTDRGRRRLDAEETVRAWGRERGVPVVVLRVGGIYGDGRLPLARLESGRPALRPEECPWTNRIHADDLAAVCLAAVEHGTPDAIYNASDGRPGTLTGYLYAVADRLGLPRPPVVDRARAAQTLSPGEWSYMQESRRLDTRRMREELGVVLRYPDLDAGLAQAVAATRRSV